MSKEVKANDEVSLSLEHKRIAMTGNALATVCVCSFLLMGFGLYNFTSYLEKQEGTLVRMDERSKETNTMRINQCHAIQTRALDLQEKTNQALSDNSQALGEIHIGFESLRESVDENTQELILLRSRSN